MWESRKRLKSADNNIRITLLILFIIMTSLFVDLNPIENNSNGIPDEQSSKNNEESQILYVDSVLRLSGTNSPVVTTFAGDETYNEGNGGQSKLKWKISDAPDDEEDKYLIYQNGTIVQNGTYLSYQFIEIFVNTLEAGIYNFTVYGNDTDGNYVIDTAYVIVTDIANPTVDMIPADFNTTEISSGNDILWRGNDLHPSHYRIFSNTSEEKIGLWNSSSEVISYNIDHLLDGAYNYTIEFFDDSGNWVNDTITIVVTDVSSPIVISSTDPLRFSEFDEDRNLILNVTDSHPNSYIIFQDGVNVTDGVWTNEALITYNLNNLPIENYTFMIQLFDEFFNFIEIYIDVEIYKVIYVKSKVPVISITNQVHEGDYESIQSNWLDFLDNPINNGSITVTLFQDQLLIDQIYYLNHTDILGAFNLVLNYTGLPVSDYNWEILFEGLEYISQTLKFNFTILPHNYNIIVSDMTDLNQGDEYEIEITVLYANNQPSLGLNSLVENIGVASDVEVNFNMLVTLIDGGQYTIIKSGSSNADGKIIFTLSIFETSLIASIDSITLETVDDQFSNPTSFNLPVEQFPVIITTGTQTTSTTTPSSISSNTDTESTSNGNQGNESQILEDYLFIILGGILGLFFVIFLLGKMRKSKQLQIEDLKNVYDLSLAEVRGISTIQLVLLTSKTGLPLYERKFKTMGVDTVLLSGVTSAISSILSEASDQQIFGLEIMESSGLSITSHKSEFSSLIFISSSSIPMIILGQMIEAHDTIEKKYGEKLISDGSTAVPEEEINKIFREHELKLDLSSDIEIDLVALEKFHTDGKTKNGTKSLAGVLLDIDINELEMQDVGRLIEIYEEEGFESNYAANFILYAYEQGLIKSKIK